MPAASEKLHALRELLAQRFPEASPPAQGRRLATGLPAIDEALGGLPCGALTEVVCAAPSCGGALLVARMLETSRRARQRVALVDGTDCFDPQSFSSDTLIHLVWVRCRALRQLMSAADLLARDANFGLVIIDVRGLPDRDLRREPSTSWYRLQRAAEQNDLPLLIETPRPLVPSAMLRLLFDRTHAFSVLENERPSLVGQLVPTIQRQRLQVAAAS